MMLWSNANSCTGLGGMQTSTATLETIDQSAKNEEVQPYKPETTVLVICPACFLCPHAPPTHRTCTEHLQYHCWIATYQK